MPEFNQRSYSGNLEEISSSLSNISYSMTIPYLQSILKCHSLPITGTKDHLVFLSKNNKAAVITDREERQLQDLVSLVNMIILEQDHSM